MKKTTIVDQTRTPDGRVLTLDEHDGAYTIRVDGSVLMGTRQHWSEERLAELACAHVKGRKGARVLIGGLGLGFTLKAALAIVAADARVTVAEILEAVIAWNRRVDLPLAAETLADPRVVVAQRDVVEVIREARGEFDSIMLDVDNGPAALTADANRGLYTMDGLLAAKAALRPDGCVAYWAAGPDATFEGMMKRAGFRVEVRTERARQGGGRRHPVFLGWVK
jgi:spermidine synthase